MKWAEVSFLVALAACSVDATIGRGLPQEEEPALPEGAIETEAADTSTCSPEEVDFGTVPLGGRRDQSVSCTLGPDASRDTAVVVVVQADEGFSFRIRPAASVETPTAIAEEATPEDLETPPAGEALENEVELLAVFEGARPGPAQALAYVHLPGEPGAQFWAKARVDPHADCILVARPAQFELEATREAHAAVELQNEGRGLCKIEQAGVDETFDGRVVYLGPAPFELEAGATLRVAIRVESAPSAAVATKLQFFDFDGAVLKAIPVLVQGSDP